MPRIRIAYVAALWSAITLGAVAHVIAESEASAPIAAVSTTVPVTLASARHKQDSLGNRYRVWAGW